MTRLLLVRHGETAWNHQRLLQGQQDLPLSEAGEEQIRDLAPLVQGHAPAQVVTSPLIRAQQSAALLGMTERITDPRWSEAHLGEWEGLSSIGLAATSPSEYRAWREGSFTPPGGESFEALQTRAVEATLGAVSAAGEAGHPVILVVTHGGPVRAVCAALTGLDPSMAVPAAPASLTILDFVGSAARLRAYNISADVAFIDPPD